jgi:small conductance mechanosensitive channel
VVFYVLIFISGIMILRVFDIDPAPVLTAAGVVGLAIGFGAQKLVKDVLSGFFIVLENQYSVGDYVTIGTVTGTVHELGMRITELRDDSGKLVIIPNGDITVVTNHSRGPLLATVDISVDPTTDLKRLQDILNEAGNEIAEKIEGVISAPTANGIIALDASKMTVRATGEVKTGRQFAVQNALREAIRTKLSDAGIQLAYEKVIKQL